jgi:hypothetical protein
MGRPETWFVAALAGATLWSTLLGSAPARTPGVERPRAKVQSVPAAEPAPKVTLRTHPHLGKQAPPSWVAAKPGPKTQVQKSSSARGVNPCMTKNPGLGAYEPWDRAPALGQMIAPRNLKLDRQGGFDVVFHFHGHEAARKEWVQAVETGVLVGIDLGTGSGPYQSGLGVPGRFARLLESVEEAIAQKAGVKRASARRIGLSAWSAGYGAVSSILRSNLRGRIDSVILLDGLHVGYREDGSLTREKLTPFVDFARQAAVGDKLMFVSHSSIIPPGYASTTETASYLVWAVGGKPSTARTRSGDPMGLELIRRFSQQNFHVRGYSGNDTLDHCAHLGLYQDVLRAHLAPRWKLRTRPPANERLAGL